MTDYINPRLVVETNKLKEGSIKWQSPSNIAIIKYWGKYGKQLPRNPSFSFTLKNAYTETTLKYEPKRGVDKGIDLTFFFEDQPMPAFEAKVKSFLENISDIFPFLRQLKLTISSSNSFPHSSGIASSASSMSALALCLCSLEDDLFGTLKEDKAFRQKASYVARLGSGSACRSIFAKAAIWGESGEVATSSNLYAIPYKQQIHEVFQSLHDDILIVSKGEKAVSSRAGHALMETNIYADNRYRQAKQRFHQLLPALEEGNLEIFGRITESEALTLHALMMTSTPPYILMRPNSLHIIQKVRAFRERNKLPLYFTLDAGPNLHLLYPDEIKKDVQAFIINDLLIHCENGQWIEDEVGEGPLQI